MCHMAQGYPSGEIVLKGKMPPLELMFHIPEEVFREPLQPAAKLLFSVLLKRTNTGIAPTQQQLALEVGESPRAIRKHLKELAQADLIRIELRGATRTNRYTVMPL